MFLRIKDNQDKLYNALSIGEERARELEKEVYDIINHCSKISKMFQRIVNSEQYQDAEKYFMLYLLGKIWQRSFGEW